MKNFISRIVQSAQNSYRFDDDKIAWCLESLGFVVLVSIALLAIFGGIFVMFAS